MFELGPAFDTKLDFKGAVLATYPKLINPLASGYLQHPEVIQGKVAALEAFYGEGRVYMYGFRPQWRGQLHGIYQFMFDAIYDSPASAKATTPPKESNDRRPNAWIGVVTKIHSDLDNLLAQNHAFALAKVARAVDERNKLAAVVDQFEKTDIADVEDTGAGTPQPGPRRAAEYARKLRKAAEDLRINERLDKLHNCSALYSGLKDKRIGSFKDFDA